MTIAAAERRIGLPMTEVSASAEVSYSDALEEGRRLVEKPLQRTFAEVFEGESADAKAVREGAVSSVVMNIARSQIAKDVSEQVLTGDNIPQTLDNRPEVLQAALQRADQELESLGVHEVHTQNIRKMDGAFGDILSQQGYEALDENNPEELGLSALTLGMDGVVDAAGIRATHEMTLTIDPGEPSVLTTIVEEELERFKNGDTDAEGFMKSAINRADEVIFGNKGLSENEKSAISGARKVREMYPDRQGDISILLPDGTVIDASAVERNHGVLDPMQIAKKVADESAKSYAYSQLNTGQKISMNTSRLGRGVVEFYNGNPDPNGDWKPNWRRIGATGAVVALAAFAVSCQVSPESPADATPQPDVTPSPDGTPDYAPASSASPSASPSIVPSTTPSPEATNTVVPQTASWNITDFESLGAHHFAYYQEATTAGDIIPPAAWGQLQRLEQEFPGCTPESCQTYVADARNGDARLGLIMTRFDGSVVFPVDSQGRIWDGNAEIDLDNTEMIPQLVTNDGEVLSPTMFFDFNVGTDGEVVAPNGQGPIDRLGWVDSDGDVIGLLIQPFTDGIAQVQIREPEQYFDQDLGMQSTADTAVVMSVDKFGGQYLGKYKVVTEGPNAGQILLDQGPIDGVYQMIEGEWVWLGDTVPVDPSPTPTPEITATPAPNLVPATENTNVILTDEQQGENNPFTVPEAYVQGEQEGAATVYFNGERLPDLPRPEDSGIDPDKVSYSYHYDQESGEVLVISRFINGEDRLWGSVQTNEAGEMQLKEVDLAEWLEEERNRNVEISLTLNDQFTYEQVVSDSLGEYQPTSIEDENTLNYMLAIAHRHMEKTGDTNKSFEQFRHDVVNGEDQIVYRNSPILDSSTGELIPEGEAVIIKRIVTYSSHERPDLFGQYAPEFPTDYSNGYNVPTPDMGMALDPETNTLFVIIEESTERVSDIKGEFLIGDHTAFTAQMLLYTNRDIELGERTADGEQIYNSSIYPDIRRIVETYVDGIIPIFWRSEE